MTKKQISQILFHILVGLSTAFILIVASWPLLLFAGFSWSSGLILVLGIFLFEWIVIFIIAGLAARKAQRGSTVWMVGLIPARHIGLFVGGIAGAKIGQGIGAIIGAVILYFVGRKVGPVLSKFIAAQLEKLVFVAWAPPSQPAFELTHRTRSFLAGYYLVVPIVFSMVIGAMYFYDISPAPYKNALPLLRIVFAALTAGVILVSWTLELSERFASLFKKAGQTGFFFVKLSYFIIPSIMGLIFYVLTSSLFDSILLNAISFLSLAGFAYRSASMKPLD